MKKLLNPVVAEVLNRFENVTEMTELFVSDITATARGLLVNGDAGTGKTRAVQQAFINTGSEDRVKYIKGSSITAPVMFCILYENRHPGNVIVLDDVDIIHKAKGEVSMILDMLKGATEPTKGERILGWMRANRNQLMIENDVPIEFDFQGSIVWITNDRTEDIAKKAEGHWNAISSRFAQVPVWLNEQEKLLYTLHMIEEVNILGPDCNALEGGFEDAVIEDTYNYILKNYKLMSDITPRVAIMIAGLRKSFPAKWEKYCDIQLIR